MLKRALLLLPLAALQAGSQAVISSPAALTSNPNAVSTSPSATGISTRLFADLERLARLVDISYCIGNTGVHKPFECLSRCKEFPGMDLVTTWSTGFLMGDSCGFIAVDHETPQATDAASSRSLGHEQRGNIIVAFRGTYSIANTVMDLGTIPQKYVPYPAPDDDDKDGDPDREPRAKCTNCTVHMGFLHSWQNARDVVVPELKALKEKYPSYKVHFVGHSLGGAVACLAALEAKLSMNYDDIVVTTFGEPRLGNYEFARFVDKVFDLTGSANLENRSFRRVTHNNDPVPHLPLEEWGYIPHSGELYISKQELSPSESDILTCVGNQDPNCSTEAEASLMQSVRRLLHFRQAQPSASEYFTARTFPTRFKLWQLFFAHRDYFWRLGLCVPGGDPANWEGWWPLNPDSGSDPETGLDEL